MSIYLLQLKNYNYISIVMCINKVLYAKVPIKKKFNLNTTSGSEMVNLQV